MLQRPSSVSLPNHRGQTGQDLCSTPAPSHHRTGIPVARHTLSEAQGEGVPAPRLTAAPPGQGSSTFPKTQNVTNGLGQERN